MIKNAYKRRYLKGAGAGAGIPAPGLRPGRNDGLLMVGLWPRDKLGIIQVMVGYSEEIKHRFTRSKRKQLCPLEHKIIIILGRGCRASLSQKLKHHVFVSRRNL